MIRSLKFVQGVIKKSSLSQDFMHYSIKDGQIIGFNGHLALAAPIELDIEVYPKADLFGKAISACSDKISLHMTKAGRLAIHSGSFKAYVPCLEEVAYVARPEGEKHETPPDFLDSIKQLYPFVAEDATRPWAMGLLMDQGSYFATNNVLCVQKWSGHTIPSINIPRFSLQELIRINETPEYIQTDQQSVSFVYAEHRWLRTQVYSLEWPIERINEILSPPINAAINPKTVPSGFAECLETLVPFMDDKSSAVYFEEGGISNDTELETGVHINFAGLPAGPIFSIHQLRLLSTVVKDIDWSLYPKPCLFSNDNLRGAVVGMNQ